MSYTPTMSVGDETRADGRAAVCTFCHRLLKTSKMDHIHLEPDSRNMELEPSVAHGSPLISDTTFGSSTCSKVTRVIGGWPSRKSLVALGVILVLIFFPVTEATITAVFSGTSQSNLRVNHLALSSSGELYVGATNHLFRVTSNLSVTEEVQTGPHLDHIECRNAFTSPSSATCSSPSGVYTKVNTDNINKILLVDSSQNKLVVCGSIFQGVCDLLPLNQISDDSNFDLNRDNNIIVASNTAEASTVGILAPGLPNPLIDTALYVGTTMGGDPTLRAHEVFAVSSRLLHGDLFELSVDDIDEGGTATKIGYVNDDCYTQSYITYVDAFSTGGYTYFLTIQHGSLCSSSPNPSYVSKIVQICQSDTTFRSYVEMPLTCGDYNLIQDVTLIEASGTLAQMLNTNQGDQIVIAAFTKSEQNSNMSTSESAICMYKLTDIRAKFRENINNCYTGVGTRSPLFNDPSDGLECQSTAPNYTPESDFCGSVTYDVNAAMYTETNAVSSSPILTMTSSQFTSVVAQNINTYTTAYIGTAQGQVNKVFFYPPSDHMVYETVALQSSAAVLQDVLISADDRSLYVPTTEKVYRVSVADCAQYTSCSTCLAAMDPHCGWCTLERKCSWKNDCSSSGSALRWLSMSEQTCTAITLVSPSTMDVDGTGIIDISIQQLPTSNNEVYMCMLDNTQFGATVFDSDTVRCAEPTDFVLPVIPNGQDHVNVTLGVSYNGVVFVDVPYTFYQCDTHNDCHSCTSSRFGCSWCTYSNQCVHSSASCGSNMPAVSSFEWCPQITQPREPQILIPAAFPTSFGLHARNLPTPLSNQQGYECLFELSTPAVRSTATVVNSSYIVCNDFEICIAWLEGRHCICGWCSTKGRCTNCSCRVDHDEMRPVYIFDCNQMAGDCGECFNIQAERSEYGCAFCGDSCRYNPTCLETPALSCPQPMDVVISPLTGPLEGGTRVTLTGSNLGSSYEEIMDSVEIAGQPCTVVQQDYVPSKTIVCITAPVSMATSGDIVLTIGEFISEHARFHYQAPILEAIEPYVGPRDGGSEVTILGQLLNTGSDISVFLDNHICTDARYVSPVTTKLYCTTSSVETPQVTSRVTVRFDNAERNLDVPFNYTDNPTITEITPTTAYSGGGRTITVTGTLLDVVLHPQMMLSQGTRTSSATDCVIESDTVMTCPSPAVPSGWSRRRRRQTSEPIEIGFNMDNVQSVRNLSANFPNVSSTLAIVPSPVYDNFDDGQTEFTSGFLVLEGENLDLACRLDEISVLIGQEECVVDSLSSTRLLCTPPEVQPMGMTAGQQFSPNVLPQVKITVSNNLVFEPGALMYADLSEPGDLPLPVIIAIAVGGGFFIVIILSIIIVYHRKSKEAQRKIKKMLIQLDMLESNVRNECKQAFAELQTEVTDLTSDLTMTGIPFWDYHTYSFKVLFPSHTDHPILHNPQSEFNESKVGFEQGLQQFNQLLNSKQFLVIFIRTLEQQKNFSIRDRAVVASLLMVVLQDKMEYATEILKALLNELIDKSVEKRNPKLLFRRTESVVEKFLTNWLSLCMYDYLKKHAGSHLFILFKAIKQQTDKGPVDAITGEARYSLSEDRLLREKIEPRVLNVNLLVEHGQEPVACKMMDCDTVTQAKEKALDAIYMNMPFSRRPSVYDVDLEWRSGRSGHLPLQDEDVTTEMVKGWKRVNTLAHYHVPDGATMALIPKRFKNDYVRQVHGMVEITSGSSLTTLTPIITVEEGTKVWHLVKHDDSQNQSRAQKVISEIFLTRLLTTKGTMQQYIDDLFKTILKVDKTLPTAIKYLFDFLDQAARRHNIVDPEVVHTWKSNSLPLRFWVNIIKNPEFVFDINKPHIVDSCLSVIAQTFMDSCSTSEHRLGKDSPTNKLLFAKDIPKYRKWVEKYYKDVQEMRPVSDQDMNVAMTELSMHYIVDFNIGSALKELFKYATHYNYELLEALDNDPSAKKLHLAHKFDQINAAIDSGTLY